MEVPSSHYHLPEDLVIEILLRLPVKSLLRFKSVCKNWHALIETPNFINDHFHHEGNNTNLLVYSTGIVMCPHIREPIYNPAHYPHSFTLFSSETLERHEEQLDHLKFPSSVYEIRGPNPQGLFCVRIKYEKLALWNPATRRMRPLPTSPQYSLIYRIIEFGFEVDPLTHESKIVIIYESRYNMNDPFEYDVHLRHDYAVYRLGDDSWRFIENDGALGHCTVPKTDNNTFLNGFYYWKKCEYITFNKVVLEFDMHKEVFDEIEMPNIDTTTKDRQELTLYNKFLALLSYNGYNWEGDRELDIWVMKEKGSWAKLLTLVLPFNIRATQAFRKNNTMFILNHDMELFLHDHDSDNMKPLKFANGEPIFYYRVFLFSYKESLAPVKEIGRFHDYDTHSPALQVFFA